MIHPQTYKGSKSMLNGEEVHLYVITHSLPISLLFVSWCNFSWTWSIAQVTSHDQWGMNTHDKWALTRSSTQLHYPTHVLSESVSKLYTNFEFCEWKNHKHLKTHRSTKPSNICWPIYFKKSLHILKDDASSVQVDGLYL
jgi:hypothetical protein